MVTTELIEKLEKLSPELQSKVKETVDQMLVEEENSDIKNQNPKFKWRFGELKGSIWISDDFDEPLDEMKDYM